MKSFFAWQPLEPASAGGGASATTARWADGSALICLLFGSLQAMLGLDVAWFRFAPLLIGIFLFGLPHGAIDHLVALGLAQRKLRFRPFASVVTVYLIVVVAVLLLWWVAPLLAALAFLAVTIFHWGKADRAFEVLSPGYAGLALKPIETAVHLALRGLIPIGLPFLAFPDDASEFTNACIQLFAPGFQLDWSLWRRFLFGIVLILFIADNWACIRRIRKPAAQRLLVENVALVGFFCFVSPLVAIGWYFVGWHGCRHFLRLCLYQPPEQTDPATMWQRMRLRNWQALPFTLVSVGMLLALSWVSRIHIDDALAAAAGYLVLISALTLPHLIIVEWMDRREVPR